MEDIEFRHPRGLEWALVLRLADCHWIKQHNKLMITGPIGVGSSCLACAFAEKAFSLTKCYEDKNLQLLIEWINLQNEPADFWTLVKMDLSRKYPAFEAWLKRRRGEKAIRSAFREKKQPTEKK